MSMAHLRMLIYDMKIIGSEEYDSEENNKIIPNILLVDNYIKRGMIEEARKEMRTNRDPINIKRKEINREDLVERERKRRFLIRDNFRNKEKEKMEN